jgi:phosphatidate cytidylyltransferase
LLRWRLLLGTLLIGALVALCWLDYASNRPGLWLAPIAFVLAVAASKEAIWLLNSKNLRPAAWVVYGGNVLIVASAFLPQLPHSGSHSIPRDACVYLAFALTILAAFIAAMRRYERPGESILQVALTIFCLAYVGLLLAIIVKLRFLLPGSAGLIPLILLITVVKLADIGAYTVGRLIGRNKMAPVLSPGKTWEGAAGAIVFACLGAVLVLNGLYPRLASNAADVPLWVGLVCGVAIGTAGMIGDLAESLFKRDMGRKDSSDWMPGFGGVLDIIDSLLLAAPVTYLCWRLLL